MRAGRDNRRLLVIGAQGFLGTHVIRRAMAEFTVIRGDRNHNGDPNSVRIDIADPGSVQRAFSDARPDLVLLLAAVSDIDRCEAFPGRASAINALGPEHVSNACARANIRLLFTSSAAVFDGKKSGYREDDERNPLSVYGKTKATAEDAIHSTLPDSSVILRFALVLGCAAKGGTNSLLDSLLERWRLGTTVSFSTREMRNPIDASTLATVMINLLADREAKGVYHVGASDVLSRYELARRLALRAGFPEERVRMQHQEIWGRAPRGEHHFLLTEKIQRDFPFALGTSDQVIERCFS